VHAPCHAATVAVRPGGLARHVGGAIAASADARLKKMNVAALGRRE
jgi:hypothetical protein